MRSMFTVAIRTGLWVGFAPGATRHDACLSWLLEGIQYMLKTKVVVKGGKVVVDKR